jgi:hypothetical protein
MYFEICLKIHIFQDNFWFNCYHVKHYAYTLTKTIENNFYFQDLGIFRRVYEKIVC